MPTWYHIDEKVDITYFVATGMTAEEDWTETRAQILTDPVYRPGMAILIDARQHESVLSTDFIAGLATTPKARSGPTDVPKWAIVVSRQVSYGLGRMFSLLAESTQVDVKVFREVGTAVSWLRGAMESRHNEPKLPYP